MYRVIDLDRRQGRVLFFLIVILFGILATGIYGWKTIATAAEDGLVGYWSFDKIGEERVLFTEDFEAWEDGYLPDEWTGWRKDNVCYFLISNDKESKSMKLIHNETDEVVDLVARSPKIPIEGGMIYSATVSSFNKTSVSELCIEFWNAAEEIIYAETKSSTSLDQWEEVAIIAIAPEGSTHATVSFYKLEVGVSYYDDVQLVMGIMVEDISGNGNHGSVMGAAELVEGRRSNGLKFDGSTSYVWIPMNNSLKSPDAITVEAWVYPTPPHHGGYGGIISNINGFSTSRLLIVYTGQLMAQIYGLEGTTFRGPNVINGDWNHVVYVYDGIKEIFYLNGQMGVSVVSPSQVLPTGDRALTIGLGHPITYYFNGIIDEFKIYNRALSEDEVVYIYRDSL